MELEVIIQIAIGAILIHNIVLTKFLGLCPFFGVSKRLSSAAGMGMAVIFVMAGASLFTWVINHYLLIPYDAVFLQTIVFILVIASLVQLVEMILQKYSPSLYESLGIYLPLITTNCAIMGVALINAETSDITGEAYTFTQSLINGVASGIGFTIALLLMAGIRERLEYANVPKPFRGLPIAFISAALMAMAFLGFSDLHFF